MKKYLSAFLLMLLPLLANAYDAEIDGIYYNFNKSDKTATVTYKSPYSYYYRGNSVTIPSFVKYNSTSYLVTAIGNDAFSYSHITSVVIPNSVTTIGSYAFAGSDFESIDIPNSVTTIENNAFDDCMNLETLEIPKSVTSIGKKAFYNCPSLTSITVDSKNKVYDSRNNCNAIIETVKEELRFGCQNTVIPNSVKTIGYYAFARCIHLESIEIPEGVTVIDAAAFSQCESLASVKFPNSLTTIAESAFRNCTSLTSVEIPKGVTGITKNSYLETPFYGCSNLSKVIFHCPRIGDWFDNMSSIKEVIIGDEVTTIGSYAFDGWTGLTTVKIPNSVETIEQRAFYGCTNLDTLIIGSGIKTLGTNILGDDYEVRPSHVYCYAEQVPSAGDAFTYLYFPFVTLHVPASVIEDYENTEPWSKFGNIVAIEEDFPETKVCATPVITYNNGQLQFTCETAGVKFVSKITCADVGDYEESTIPLASAYTVSVYATATGYQPSETVTETITLTGTGGLDIDGDGELTIGDITKLIDAYLEK